jgi:hypothetical protein
MRLFPLNVHDSRNFKIVDAIQIEMVFECGKVERERTGLHHSCRRGY